MVDQGEDGEDYSLGLGCLGLTFSSTSWATLGKCSNLSEPQVPHPLKWGQ